MLLYNSLTFVVSIVLFPFFSLHKRGRKYLTERYGVWDLSKLRDIYLSSDKKNKSIIWLHAASVGEVKGVAPIVSEISKNYPQDILLMTTISDKGKETALELPEFKDTNAVYLLPFDCKFFYPEILKSKRVKFFVSAETEFWPQLHNFLKKNEIPSFIVNARISDKTFPRYRIFKFLCQRALNHLNAIFCSDNKSMLRFVSLGVTNPKLIIAGNAKYEDRINKIATNQISDLKAKIISNNLPVVTLGSLRPDEEKIWFKVIKDGGYEKKLNLVIVPRHLEKVEYFSKQLELFGLKHVIVDKDSKKNDFNVEGSNIIIVNQFGVLDYIYGFSDLAFVGGSLVPIGGHNPLEPAKYAVPTLMGQYYSNVEEVVEEMQAKEAILIIKDERDLNEVLENYLSSPNDFKRLGYNAKAVRDFYQGTAERVVRDIINMERRAPARLLANH